MHHPVCTLSPHRAILAPFLPSPTPGPDTPPPPEFCACGEPLTREMERDEACCVECLAEAAGVSHGGMA